MKRLPVFFIALILVAGCGNFGKKVSKEYLEIYYKDGITKEQAEKTLEYFYPKWRDKGDETGRKSIQLTKKGDTINFRMVSNMEVMDKMDDAVFYTTGVELSSDLFNGAPVNVILTNNKFKPIRTYVFKKMALPDYGEKVLVGNIEVYYKDDITAEDADRMATYINGSMSPENFISFQAGRDEGGFLLVRMVSNREKADQINDEKFYALAKTISEKVFAGDPVVFQLTDKMFKPFRTFEYKTDAASMTEEISEE